VIILSPREAVARRFASTLIAPIPDAPKILVLDPARIPAITTEQATALHPTEILLSTALAGKTGRIDIGAIELALTRIYEDDQAFADRCLDTICKYWLTKPDRRTLMSLIENRPYTFKSEPFLDRIKAAEAKTKAEDARQVGATLLKVLDSRKITVTRQVREDIAACTDLDRLDAAIVRAAIADPKDPFAF
jgi:predicted MarR family transcription regulator